MTFKRNGVNPTTVKRRSGSNWVDVQTIKRRSGSGWVTVWTAYTPITITGVGDVSRSTGRGGGSVIVGTSTVRFTGGEGTKTYRWEYVSGDNAFTTTGATTDTCQFSRNHLVTGTFTATWKVTVSDGQSSDSTTITVTLTVT